MSEIYTESLKKLIEEFGRLPGIGPKTAQRLAFHILYAKKDEAMALAQAVSDVKTKIKSCKINSSVFYPHKKQKIVRNNIYRNSMLRNLKDKYRGDPVGINYS